MAHQLNSAAGPRFCVACANLAARLLTVAITSCHLVPVSDASAAGTIYVKVLVDDEERERERAWKERLQKRVEGASAVMSRYCVLKFVVASHGRWDSDDRIVDFRQSMREFEREVSPRPDHIAIGFTSQYRFKKGRNSLGGTRGPLHSHVLIREGAEVIHDTERIEVLIHELGHFLGAAHSLSPTSAMRPVLGDGLARSRKFLIGFDPDNARIIRLVAGEVNDRKVRHFSHLSQRTRQQLRPHYVSLAKQYPNDPTARYYVQLLDSATKRHSTIRRP